MIRTLQKADGEKKERERERERERGREREREIAKMNGRRDKDTHQRLYWLWRFDHS